MYFKLKLKSINTIEPCLFSAMTKIYMTCTPDKKNYLLFTKLYVK